MIDTVLIGFAFSAGAVTFLNPCGFAMLPSYVSYFVESNTQQIINSGSNSRLILVRRLARGGLVGILVTAAFIANFGLAGIAISSIGIGIAKIFGRTIHINIPSPRGLFYTTKGGNEGGKEPSFLNFFLFGIGYSIASLSCTLPLFQGLSAGGIKEGSIVFST